MRVISTTKVFSAPGPGMSAYENSYYARPEGLEKIRLRSIDVSDDMFGDRQLAFSADNGHSACRCSTAPASGPTTR